MDQVPPQHRQQWAFVCNNSTKKKQKNLHSLQKEKFGKPHAMLEGNGVLCTWRWNVKIILGSVCVCFFFFVEGGGAKIMPVLFQYTT